MSKNKKESSSSIFFLILTGCIILLIHNILFFPLFYIEFSYLIIPLEILGFFLLSIGLLLVSKEKILLKNFESSTLDKIIS